MAWKKRKVLLKENRNTRRNTTKTNLKNEEKFVPTGLGRVSLKQVTQLLLLSAIYVQIMRTFSPAACYRFDSLRAVYNTKRHRLN